MADSDVVNDDADVVVRRGVVRDDCMVKALTLTDTAMSARTRLARRTEPAMVVVQVVTVSVWPWRAVDLNSYAVMKCTFLSVTD